MYAIIEVGGKQYKVEKGEILAVEKLKEQEGKDAHLNRVLLIAKDKEVEIGQPYIKGAKVTATILKHIKAKKVISYKYRRRKSSSHWKKGHRQQLTQIKIKDIELVSKQ